MDKRKLFDDKEYWHVIYDNNIPLHYSISSYGRVRNDKTGNILKTSKDQNGYHFITLTLNNGRRKMFRINRLVANAFYPVKLISETDVNHIDGNKDNNYASNLEHCTHQKNMEHANKNGLIKRVKGEKHHKTTSSNKEILEIIQLMREGYTNTEIYNKMNPSIERTKFMQKLFYIRNGGWSNLTSQFNDIPKHSTRSIYSKNLLDSIGQLLAENKSREEIIELLKLDSSDSRYMPLIRDIKKGKRFPYLKEKFKF